MRIPPDQLLSAILASLAVGAVHAQTPIHTFTAGAGESLGTAVSAAGDVDGDDVEDVVVGRGGAGLNGLVEAGAIDVYSGLDGSLLFSVDGTVSGARLGYSVAAAGDVDGDGYDDVAAGSPFETNAGGTEAGRVQVFSGFDGSVLLDEPGTMAYGRLGWSVAGVGDLNGDGSDDVAAGAPANTGFAPAGGYAHVHSGFDGSVLLPFTGSGYVKHFGYSIAGAGDVDGDLVGDVIVGEPGYGGAGRAVVHSGADGSVIWNLDQAAAGDFLGGAVAGADDLDGDGRADLLVGAPRFSGPGYAVAYSGLTGAPLFTLAGGGDGDRFGISVAAAGDFDGDGVLDVAVGASGDDAAAPAAGAARVFSGDCGRLVWELEGSATSAQVGSSVAGLADVDGDGRDELVVGLVGLNRVEVHGGTSAFTSYCTAGTSASGCQALLSAVGTPSATAPSGFDLYASNVEGAKDGIFFFGTNGRQAGPWGNGSSYRCVVPPLKRGGLVSGGGSNNTCAGVMTQDLNAHWTARPAHNPGSGALVQAQLWYRDPVNTSNQTTSFSDAVEFTVCP